KVTQKLDRAAHIGDRLGQLIETLLDVSRISAGQIKLRLEPFDLCDAAREVVERLRDGAAGAGCELTLTAEAPLLGTWDRLRIEQVLMNLISNAIKYAAGKPIRVSVTREAAMAVLRVRDGGPG